MKIKSQILDFIYILVIFCFDRLSKIIIINFLNSNNNEQIVISNFLSLNLIWNKGIAFGLFSQNDNFYYQLLTAFIALIIILIFFLMKKSEGLEKYGFLMVLGGSLGNIFDRILYSSVPDFIDFYFKDFHWFVFNVADIFITLGISILIFSEIKKKNYE